MYNAALGRGARERNPGSYGRFPANTRKVVCVDANSRARRLHIIWSLFLNPKRLEPAFSDAGKGASADARPVFSRKRLDISDHALYMPL
jgi:hypothetical protein